MSNLISCDDKCVITIGEKKYLRNPLEEGWAGIYWINKIGTIEDCNILEKEQEVIINKVPARKLCKYSNTTSLENCKHISCYRQDTKEYYSSGLKRAKEYILNLIKEDSKKESVEDKKLDSEKCQICEEKMELIYMAKCYTCNTILCFNCEIHMINTYRSKHFTQFSLNKCQACSVYFDLEDCNSTFCPQNIGEVWRCYNCDNDE